MLYEFFPELLSSHEFVGHSSEELILRDFLHSVSTDSFHLDIVIFWRRGWAEVGVVMEWFML